MTLKSFNKMRKHIGWLILISLSICTLLVLSCSGNEDDGNFDVQFRVPSSATIDINDQTFEFRIQFNKAPRESDKIILKDPANVEHTCDIISIADSRFTISLYIGMLAGDYEVSVQRGKQTKVMGTMSVTITGDGIEPEDGVTLYGQVVCDGNGVSGVVVSDGVEVVTTDSKGVYQMKSAKYHKYVFISVPSGYEPLANGILPTISKTLTKSSSTAERVDFSLVKAAGQDKYKIFFLGDMHLANRTSDRTQFTAFTNDFNTYRDAHKSEKMYAVTLGDMTWDLYWYSNSYEFKNYLSDINSRVSDILIYHTIGNHDNDYLTKSDFDAEFKYTEEIAPTFYSFNIGKVHYVILDDIDCSAYDGTTSRNYTKKISQEQLDWLKKDLSYVSTSTPLIIVTHAQIFYPSGLNTYKLDHDASSTNSLFSTVKNYSTVHYITGHTHTIFNVNPAESKSLASNSNTYEHNAGSICASWWWSGHLTSGVYVSLDGCPGGYSIWDVDGTSLKWKYKGTNKDENYQFRSYDLNNVSFSYDDVPNLTNESMKSEFSKYIKAYPASSNNEVLINIWNWNSNWSLSVTDENGKSLSYTKTYAYDPLHIKALSVPRFNKSSLTSTPSFITENKMPHFFKVKADNADVDLVIKVTDEFGNVYTENMARPKAFNGLSDYTKY